MMEIIEPSFRKMQAHLLDYAAGRGGERVPEHRRQIEDAVNLIRTIHHASPAEACAKLRAMAEACQASPYLRANMRAMADKLEPQNSRRAETEPAPQVRDRLRRSTAATQNMGTKPRPDAPEAPAYWWDKL